MRSTQTKQKKGEGEGEGNNQDKVRRKNKKANHQFCHNKNGREREGEEREERKDGAKKENRTNIKPKKRGHCEEFQNMKGMQKNFKN